MHSDTAAGGVADVHWGTASPEQAAVSERVQVYVVPDHYEYRAESYSLNGRRIRFCGHGSMAAAWVGFNEPGVPAGPLNFYSHSLDWQARRSGNQITLAYQRPAVTSCRVPAFIEPLLGIRSQTAAVVGGDRGYLIVRLSEPEQVQGLEFDPAELTAATDRALIVTACASDTEFVFRYFAPQYGSPEDAATGSAAVQLGAFWCSRLPTQRFHVRQLSRHGAEMQVACRPSAVELTARVAYL